MKKYYLLLILFLAAALAWLIENARGYDNVYRRLRIGKPRSSDVVK